MSHITLVHSREAQDKIILAKPLPPAWDGRPIEWEIPWQIETVIVCAHWNKSSMCWAKDERGVRCNSERFATIRAYIKRFALLQLSRCLECGHDTVAEQGGWNGSLGEVWDLDDTDYGPSGSWAA